MSYNIHPQDLELPSSIGKYQIVGEIGRGGFGMVLKARHEGLNKLVAIKLLHAALVMDPSVRARFELEAKAGATLSHPNLVSVFDYGFTERGEPYLVMEYVDGMNLEEYIEERKPSSSELIPILMQVAKALRYLHESKIVHRDLKTSNILVQRIGDETYARLLDLGIAKVFGSDAGSTTSGGKKASPTLTGTGMIFGSPSFMSPEQCQGMPVDARSDVYSFGCVIYQCLTGELPFNGDNPMVVMLKHLSEEVPIAQVATAQERELAQIAVKCMAKDREQRFPSMKELNEALQRALDAGSAAGNARGMSVSRSYMAVESPAGAARGGTARGGSADDVRGGSSTAGGMNPAMIGLMVAFAAVLFCAIGYFAFQQSSGKKVEEAATSAPPRVVPVLREADTSVKAAPPSTVAPSAVSAEAQKVLEQAKQYAEQARADRLAAEQATKKAQDATKAAEDATKAAEDAKRVTQATAATAAPTLADQVARAQAQNRALGSMMDERYKMVQSQLNSFNQRTAPANPYDAVGNMAAGNAAMRAQFGKVQPGRQLQNGVSTYNGSR